MAAGLLLVLSGPSGVGKTTIAHEMLRRFGGHFSVSATTRAPTNEEKNNVDYSFVSPEVFQQMIDQKLFIEFAQVFGRSWYGTPRQPVDAALARGELAVLDIDVQGAELVRDKYPDMLGIFILPPSEESLLTRLRQRGREDESAIQRRFRESTVEMQRARDNGIYNAFVINDDLTAAIEEVALLVSEKLKTHITHRAH
ncbi:MAG: guanylate kinase [Planctomycetota bacterium]|nr:MAG: guanylate kinase [Planctomycetota bacterium]